MMDLPPVSATHLIIERPDWQTRRQRLTYGSFSALFWAFWGYLWLPLLTAAGWLGEGFFAWHHMIQLRGFIAFEHLAASYVGTLTVLGGIFVGWAMYNYLRFRGYDRRKPRPTVTDQDLAAFYNVPQPDVEQWHKAKRLVVWHAENGQVIRVDAGSPPAPPTVVPGPVPQPAPPVMH
ncbi:biofilm PGA synthesis protein PgaD [Silvimonas terrae]|uniref:Biofilm PGA synthesis protein PgaD n=1 Tax=Silvimonas terrae TaxID=300266 RepID=A0A840RDM5_9NEIS|nr:poly-beta-1,6-N-acetyl-D-glucosamine biosynthesis protein PgaD [Silvimonas terrae]MBB5191589.1 biofilm PGA synthesis protein PgaD [Silvimonas terrae]